MHAAAARRYVAPTLIALAVTGLSASIAVAAPASHDETRTITGGHTALALSSKALSRLDGHHITVSPSGAATLKNDTVKLPVVGGTANLPYYVIDHAGGFVLTHGSHSVKISKMVMRTKKSEATAVVSGAGRMVAFAIGSPQRGGGSQTYLAFGGYSVAFTRAAATTIDQALHTTAFAKHRDLGIGDTRVNTTG